MNTFVLEPRFEADLKEPVEVDVSWSDDGDDDSEGRWLSAVPLPFLRSSLSSILNLSPTDKLCSQNRRSPKPTDDGNAKTLDHSEYSVILECCIPGEDSETETDSSESVVKTVHYSLNLRYDEAVNAQLLSWPRRVVEMPENTITTTTAHMLTQDSNSALIAKQPVAEKFLNYSSFEEMTRTQKSSSSKPIASDRIGVVNKSTQWWRSSQMKVLLFAQLLSFLQATVNVLRAELSRAQWRAAALMTAPMYLTLWLLTSAVLRLKGTSGGFLPPTKGLWYLCAAVLDVEGNRLLLAAYEYTSITSATLLDSFNIPAAVALSWPLFGRTPTGGQLAAICLAFVGVWLLLGVDEAVGSRSAVHSDSPVIGDVMTAFGAAFVGVAAVIEEVLVKRRSALQLLNTVALFGFVLCTAQGILFERNALSDCVCDGRRVMYYVAYVCCNALYYALLPHFLAVSNATVLALSLLTCDLYSLVAGIVLFHETLHTLYFVSFACVTVAVFAFNALEKPQSN